MSPSLQAKFLRILQDGALQRVGGKAELRVDVRVIAATNRDAAARSLKDGTLREDLYYRLNVFTIVLPPLRTRREDIPLLVQAFIEEFNAKYERQVRGVDDPRLRFLVGHDGRATCGELRNVIERAVIGCAGELISCGGAARRAGHASAAEAVAVAAGRPVAVPAASDVERELILKTLASVDNNKTRAAELLGISLRPFTTSSTGTASSMRWSLKRRRPPSSPCSSWGWW